MKNFDTRTYSISDFLEWDKNKLLVLSPAFQRRDVWTENARSYLMDTIIRGKPIPKIFIRQKNNPLTKEMIREVVDGQQRLRTILTYIKDGFQIKKSHNPQYSGLYFSQLDDVDQEIQLQILNYEISVDLLYMNDPEVLDVFTRLNSYSMVLNEQEKINAQHFGDFKVLADNVSRSYYDFWVDNDILSKQKIARMDDVSLVAELLIAMLEGVKSKKQVKQYYQLWEDKFDYDTDEIEEKFKTTIIFIAEIFGNTLRTSEFKRVSLFYSLFVAIYHVLYGVRGIKIERDGLVGNNYPRYRTKLERVDTLFSTEIDNLDGDSRQFVEDSRRATTDATIRIRRTDYILRLLNSD